MLKFRFAGNLRRHFRQITLNVDTPTQGLRLLLAQCPAFKRDFYKTRLRMRIAGEDVSVADLEFNMNRTLRDGSTVLFVPVVEGAIAGVGLATWVLIGLTVASIALSVYMMSTQKTKTSAESSQTNSITNNSFTSLDNRVGQGRAVPILLGEMMVGSNVESVGIDTTNNQDWDISIS